VYKSEGLMVDEVDEAWITGSNTILSWKNHGRIMKGKRIE